MKTIILHEDKDILVCHKPAGLAVENAAVGRMDMVSELKNYLKSSYLGVIHRLDQPVEGLLVFAKNPKSAADLSRQLTRNTLNKQYYAVVCGQPDSNKGKLVDYLSKDNKTRMAKVVNKNDADAKEAILEYEVMQTKECEDTITDDATNFVPIISLLRVQIQTGRFHQIRAQLSHAGIPILGDQKYGNGASNQLAQLTGTRNVALCACSLNFKHPVTGQGMTFEIIPESGAFNLFSFK